MVTVYTVSNRKRSKKAGLPPGALIYLGDKRTPHAKITVFDYSSAECQELEFKDPADLSRFKQGPAVSWINVDGIDHVDVVEKIGKGFEIHPLVLEDVLNTNQRPKRAMYGDYLYLVFKMLSLDAKGQVLVEQVSLILGHSYLISFQEEMNSDVFGKVRESLRTNRGGIRNKGSDFLAYALLDTVVDNYFLVLESFGERLESLEQAIINSPSDKTVQEIYAIKRELLFLRRNIWPLREMVSGLERGDTELVRANTGLYLRDVYDHVVEMIELLEMYRDMASSMLEIYLTSINNRINSVMKVLAMVATIFMPLTFIAGIYGMNFENMPELKWRYGYPFALLLMIFVGLAMVFFFRRKRWIGSIE